jgi:RimJ/RimL family protein N-acetyltransferase
MFASGSATETVSSKRWCTSTGTTANGTSKPSVIERPAALAAVADFGYVTTMLSASVGPAYRITTPRLVIRCYRLEDAALLKHAIDHSLDHLKPWMPWAQTRDPLERYVTRLRAHRAAFDLGQEFIYGVFDEAETALLGGAGFHPRVGPRALEIGYWVHVDHVRRGLATEIAAALTKVAILVEKVERVDIHCDCRNEPSAAVARKLGFHCEGTLRKRVLGADGTLRDALFFTMLADELARSPCASLQVHAFDALGHRLL